jgi:hypothetical protein
MQYIKVVWRHRDAKSPVLLYSELDSERYESRKIDFYADGHRGFADSEEDSGGTFLGTVPIPSLEEIAADPQFVPADISAEEFEREWANRHE